MPSATKVVRSKIAWAMHQAMIFSILFTPHISSQSATRDIKPNISDKSHKDSTTCERLRICILLKSLEMPYGFLLGIRDQVSGKTHSVFGCVACSAHTDPAICRRPENASSKGAYAAHGSLHTSVTFHLERAKSPNCSKELRNIFKQQCSASVLLEQAVT